MPIVDLSQPLADDMLVWPGNQRPVFEWKLRAESDHCNVTCFSMNVHTGTHADSPKHFLRDGASIHALPLERFWGKARVFHFRETPSGQAIPLEAVRGSGFQLGDAPIFILHTGVDAFAGTRKYNDCYPVPGYDLLDWLVEQGMTSFMTDAPAVDTMAENDASPRHKRLFEKGVPIVENLANLGQLPEGKDFMVSAMPLSLAGREGSPVRAAAWID